MNELKLKSKEGTVIASNDGCIILSRQQLGRLATMSQVMLKCDRPVGLDMGTSVGSGNVPFFPPSFPLTPYGWKEGSRCDPMRPKAQPPQLFSCCLLSQCHKRLLLQISVMREAAVKGARGLLAGDFR